MHFHRMSCDNNQSGRKVRPEGEKYEEKNGNQQPVGQQGDSQVSPACGNYINTSKLIVLGEEVGKLRKEFLILSDQES